MTTEKEAPPAGEGEAKPAKRGRHYLSTLEWYTLCRAVIPIHSAFSSEGCFGVYLVGSALERADFRDVDVRAILNDAEFDRVFGRIEDGGRLTDGNGLWSLLCASVSAWLSQQTGLRVDFQVQRQSAANARYRQRDGHFRNALLDLEPCFAAGGDATFVVDSSTSEPPR